MKREIIIPLNEADWLRMRAFDLTSTDIAALFGCSPYCTAFELWHRKKNQQIVDIDPNERMKWGTRLQDAIAAGIAEEEGWTTRRMNEYIRIPELRLGSSFDHSIELHDEKEGFGLLEIKNVDFIQFKQGWLIDDDGSIEAPAHIELQAQHQMLVSGRSYNYIGALVGGNDLKLLPREKNDKIHKAIVAKAEAFWASIEANEPPDPDFARDAEYINSIYNFAEPGKVIDISGNAELEEKLRLYKEHTEASKKATESRDAIKAELLTKIGAAEKVIFSGGSISAGLVGPTLVEAYEKKGYRNFRVNFKKEWK